MSPTLRDQLAAARLMSIKQRARLPICPGCGKRHKQRGGLLDLLRGGFLPDDDAPPAPDKSRH